MSHPTLPAPIRPKRVFYVAGPGDAIQAHEHWRQGIQAPTEVSITFSSQIEQYVKDAGAQLYMVSYHHRASHRQDGGYTIEHLPKPHPDATGVVYFYRELVYGLKLLRRAISFKADVAILDSGCTLYFWQSIFALAGIKVVPVLHNSLWPNGFRPTRLSARVLSWVDRLFWRHVPLASLCVSPACARQVEELAGPQKRPLIQIRAQFTPEYFELIPPPPPHSRKPFQIMFIGRVTEGKGVLDIVEMAQSIEKRAPGRVRWVICGTGAELESVRLHVTERKLENCIHINGWTSLTDLVEIYAQSHCSIVPTRSTFVEGLAMTAAEAALAGRPLISNPVVPALELLKEAAVAGRTNDPESYVEKILELIDDPERYQQLADACPQAASPFLDRRYGLTHVLKVLLNGEGELVEAPK